MDLPAKLKLVALCAYNYSVLINVIILVGAYFVDVTIDLQTYTQGN